MRLFRDAKYVTSSACAAVVLSALRSFLILRIVGPTVIGVWKSAMILYTVGEFGRLGVSRGMSVQLPFLRGQRNTRESGKLTAAAGSFALLSGAVIGAAIFAATFLVTSEDYRIALRLMAVIVLCAQPHQFLRDLTAARRLFPLRAKEHLLSSAVDFVGFIVLGSLFGLTGLGVAALIGIVVPVAYLWRGQRLRFRFRLPRASIRRLIRAGLPLSGCYAAFEFIRRIDLIVIALLLGPTWVGYYGLSLLLLDFSSYLAKYGISQVVAPNLLHRFGRVGRLADVAVFYETPARLFCYVLPPLLSVGVLLIPGFVEALLPQYVPGIVAAQVSVWGIFFVTVRASMESFLVAARMIQALLKMFALLIPFGVLAHVWVLKLGFGLPAVALTTVGILGLVAGAEVYLARKSCGHHTSETVKYLGSLCFPLAAAVGLTVWVDSLALGDGVFGGFQTPVKVVLVLALYTPVLFLYEARFALLRRTVKEAA